MSESQHPSPVDPRPDDSPHQTTSGPDPADPGCASAEPAPEPEMTPNQPETIRTVAETAQGQRVTRRTVDRREVTEHTYETITEDIPLAAYQGPGSAHPAPVG